MEEGIKLITTESIVNDTVEKTVNELTYYVREGIVDAAMLAAMFKKVSIINEELNKNKELKEKFYNSTRDYISGGYEKLCGLKVQVATVATSYDYKPCEHPILNRLLEIQEAVNDAIKSIQSELQDMAKEQERQVTKANIFGIQEIKKTIVVEKMPVLSWEEGDGEIATIYPPIRRTISGLKYFKK